jgi:hypothetical protein
MPKNISAAAAAATRQSVAGWQLEQRVRRFGFEGYGDYLGSSAWYRLKGRYRKSGLPQDCFLCGADEEIDLHHRTYERICEEDLADLVPLCAPCHRLAHELVRRGDLPDFDTASLRSLVDADRARENRGQHAPNESHVEIEARKRVTAAAAQLTRKLDRVESQLDRAKQRGKRTGLLEAQRDRIRRRLTRYESLLGPTFIPR